MKPGRIIALSCLCVGVLAWAHGAEAEAPAPHVLVLNSYHPQYQWTEDLVHGVRDELVLLSDRTSLGEGMKKVARGVIPRFEAPSRTIEIWDDFTLDELSERVARLDEGTVLLLLAIHEDRAGNYFSFPAHLRPLTDKSRVPMAPRQATHP